MLDPISIPKKAGNTPVKESTNHSVAVSKTNHGIVYGLNISQTLRISLAEHNPRKNKKQ